eukprot:309012-Rhodomonas_salina.1
MGGREGEQGVKVQGVRERGRVRGRAVAASRGRGGDDSTQHPAASALTFSLAGSLALALLLS